MRAGAVKANVYAIVDRDPLGLGLVALETVIV